MNDSSFNWAVIGAGPAGIAAVGKLIDNGVAPNSIAWLDPGFKVGDFGTKWRNVSSNTRVKLFTKFFQSCQSFQFNTAPHRFDIQDLKPDETCLLSLAADPLQWITETLQQSVHTIKEKALQLKLSNRQWDITLASATIHAKNVILAIGAEPTPLHFPKIKDIPLEIALDPKKLSAACSEQDVIAVFGSSHSAMIIIQSLLEMNTVKKVINFYRQPLRYAVHFDDWILFDDTGLKGKTAEWARKHIDGIHPDKLERIISDQANIETVLPQCTQAIYATGFKQRHLPIEGLPNLTYNNKNGILAPGLFGLGIAFPEAKHDRYGTLEYRIGLWKFMEYLNHIMPVWLKYGV